MMAHSRFRGLAFLLLVPNRVYIEVLDEVWMAYFEIWDEEARALGYANYEAYRQALEEGQANGIREGIKPQISIAEPDQ